MKPNYTPLTRFMDLVEAVLGRKEIFYNEKFSKKMNI